MIEFSLKTLLMTTFSALFSFTLKFISKLLPGCAFTTERGVGVNLLRTSSIHVFEVVRFSRTQLTSDFS